MMNDNIRHILETSVISFNVSKDKNDKDSIYVGDLKEALLGNKEARENILDFCKRQENITREIENEIPKMVEVINKYFKD